MKKFLLALCLLMGHAALYAATDILSTPSAHGSDFVTVTFNANGGTGGATITQMPGSKLEAPIVARPGHIFVGWDPEVPKVVPREARTYTATWKKFKGEWADLGFVRGKSNSNSHAFIDEFYTNNPSLEDELGRCTVIGLPKGITFKQRDYPDDLEFSISGKTSVPVGDYPVLFQFEDSSYISAKIKVREPLPSFTATYKSTTKEVLVGWDYGCYWPMETKANVDVEYQVVNGELKKIKYKSSYSDNEYGSWNREYEISDTKYRAVITRDGKEAIAMGGRYDYPTRGGVEYECLYAAILFWDDNTVTGGVGYDYEDARGNIYIIEGHGNWGGAPIEVECTSYFGVENIGSGSGKTTHSGTVALGNSVTLKATADKGTVFAGWYSNKEGTKPLETSVDYRTASLAYTIANTIDEKIDEKVYAKFVTAGEDNHLTLTVKNKADDTTAESFILNGETELALIVDSYSLPKVSVKGLPTGMKFTAKPVMKKGSKTEVEYPANTIYGTPTKPGIYTVTVSLTNTTIKKAITKTFDIEVPNLTAANGYFESGLNNDEGESYKVTAGGDLSDLSLIHLKNPNNKLAVSGLPAGLKYDAKTGRIVGVPTKAGAYTVTLTVTEGKNKSISTITVEVDAEEISLDLSAVMNKTLNVGQMDDTLTIGATATSGIKSIAAAKLPTGMKVQCIDGDWQLVGAPKKAGTYNVTLTVTTKIGTKTTKAFTLFVALIPEWVTGKYICEKLENMWWCDDCYEFEYAFGPGWFEIDATGNVLGEIHLRDDSSYTYANINSKATVKLREDGTYALKFSLKVYTEHHDGRIEYEGNFTFEVIVHKDDSLVLDHGDDFDYVRGTFWK